MFNDPPGLVEHAADGHKHEQHHKSLPAVCVFVRLLKSVMSVVVEGGQMLDSLPHLHFPGCYRDLIPSIFLAHLDTVCLSWLPCQFVLILLALAGSPQHRSESQHRNK